MDYNYCYEGIFNPIKTTSSWRAVYAATELAPHYQGEIPLFRLWHPEFDWDSGTGSDQFHPDLHLGDLEKANEYISSVIDQNWFKKAVDTSKWDSEAPLRIRDLAYSSNPERRASAVAMSGSSAERQRHAIYLRQPHRFTSSKLILLHELSHIVSNTHTKVTNQNSSEHGSTFRGSYIHVVHHALGEHASKALMEGYRQHGLDWNFDAIHPDARLSQLAGTPRKTISTYHNPDVYHNPETYPVDVTCRHCRFNKDLEEYRMEIGNSTLPAELKSIVNPGKIYKYLSNYAYCDTCLHECKVAVAFDEKTQSWINQERWFNQQEWNSLQ